MIMDDLLKQFSILGPPLLCSSQWSEIPKIFKTIEISKVLIFPSIFKFLSNLPLKIHFSVDLSQFQIQKIGTSKNTDFFQISKTGIIWGTNCIFLIHFTILESLNHGKSGNVSWKIKCCFTEGNFGF